jgi:DNA-binding transcriptional LysR family regulator
VAAGTGISVLPLSTAGFYTRSDVVAVPIEDIGPNHVCLAWSASRRSRAIYSFAELATGLSWTASTLST